MKPLTLAEVNAAIRSENARLVRNGEGDGDTWGEYQSAEEPYTGFLFQTLRKRGAAYQNATVTVVPFGWVDEHVGKPVGLVLARFNRILETIPEPEEVEA